MNTLSESARPAAGVDPTDVALLQAVADMRPGWVVLRDCLLADDGQGTRARVRYALLHPEIGIALLDVLPGTTTPGAPHRMRRMLDATSFRLAFGDYPPSCTSVSRRAGFPRSYRCWHGILDCCRRSRWRGGTPGLPPCSRRSR